MTSLSAMTPSQSNMIRSTVRNASAARLLPSQRRNLSWGRFDGKHLTPRPAAAPLASSQPQASPEPGFDSSAMSVTTGAAGPAPSEVASVGWAAGWPS